jgi:PelA/Pel-15E family pectate lyase
MRTVSPRFPRLRLPILGCLACLLCQAPALPDSLLRKPDEWFRSEEGKQAVENVMSWQSASGSWPKNRDSSASPRDRDAKPDPTGTFDNGATTAELRFLARAFHLTGESRARAAVLRGLDHILDAQYRNGGWPQFHPPGKGYHRHITFNDHSMVRLLEFLRDAAGKPEFGFLPEPKRAQARAAFERGVKCILSCQYRHKGRLTVWCAQHDAVSLRPAAARSYELPSLSGAESAGILRFLMSLENPDPEAIGAVEAGVEWFREHRITDWKLEKTANGRMLLPSAGAKPLWARFYELETGAPFYCDRDGKPTPDHNRLSRERRDGYSWVGNWGEDVLRAYERWPHRRTTAESP